MTADEAMVLLLEMEKDNGLITKDAYSPDQSRYPDGRVPFVDVHMNYLRTHKNVDPKNYLSNLRLMITSRA